jgi:peptide/nickel transport system substrate-binding protein
MGVRLASAVLAVLVAAACSSPSQPAGEAPAPAGRDTLVFASSADATTLDPHNTTDTQSDQIISMVYETLLRFDDDMRIVGGLAEAWTVGEDGLTWTFKLRDGVAFHDGAPFDAEAVKRNFDRVMDPKQGHRRRDLFTAFDRVEAVDDRTVRIVTAYPFGAMEPTMAHVSAAIVSPKAAAAHGKGLGVTAEANAGTGPYRVVSWKKDVEVVLERFDGYWGTKGRLRRVVYRPIPEAASRVIALEAGDVDVIDRIPPSDVERLSEAADIEVLKRVSIGSQQFRFHCQKRPFDDPRVRRAISLAVDRRAIIDRLMPGTALPSTGPLTSIMRGRADLGEIPYDPEQARRLLAEAGYPKGFKTTITTTPRYVMGVELAEALAAQLQKVGIEARIEVLEWAAIRRFWSGLTAAENPLEIFIMGAGASSADADWGLRPIFATAKTNENNYGYYSNREFDDLIERARREIDRDKRNALYRRAQEIVYLEDPGAIWLYDLYHVVAARRSVKGLTRSALGTVTFEAATVGQQESGD